MAIANRVKLTTFLSATTPDDGVFDHENYWKLIGCDGIVVSEEFEIGSYRPELGQQILIDFGDALQKLNLENHNPEGDGFLRVFLSDLALLE